MPVDPGRATPVEPDAMVRWLFDNSREIMFVLGADRRFKLVNPAFERATGWTEAEVIGRPAREVLNPGDDEAIAAHLARLSAFGVSDSVTRVLMKDGAWRWFEGRSQLTEDDHIIGVIRDATEEREREAELEEARRTGQMLSQAAGVGTWSYDPDTDRVVWSPDILSVLGYAPDDIPDSAAFEALLHPSERAKVLDAFVAGTVKGEARVLEHRMRAKNGRWTHWRATFRSEPRPGGAFALKGLSQHVSELAEARDAARRGERHVRQLIEDAPFAVAMFDRQLRCHVASASWRRAFGVEEHDYVGRTIEEAFPIVPKRLVAAQRQALAGEVVHREEDSFTHGRLGKRWVRWEVRPWRDGGGRVRGVLAYVDDVSPLAKARKEAQQNARRLKLALEAAQAGVYEIDHQSKTFWVSPEYKRLFGGAAAGYEEAQRLQFPRFHPADVQHVRESFLKIRDDRENPGDTFEARVITGNGAVRWMRVFHRLKRDRNGRPLKGVGMVQDFDERKRQELALIEAQRAAQAASEAKAAFLANMSHEIRTPMNGVMGVLHLLKDEPLSEEGRRMLDEALSCGRMLAELLDDVIDFSKIEAGRLELNAEPVDLDALVEGVARLLRPQAAAKGLNLVVETYGELGWAMTDPVRLRQGLFNLVGNAVKFTLKGQVAIRAMIKASPEGPRLRLEVADTGVGIPEAVQPRIFQRFDQGDASTTRRFGGSGLGLAITRRLAEMLGGEVGFASTEGVGSVFWLEIAAPPAQAVAAEAEVGEACLEGLRVLVVEDNPTNRLIATKLLEKLGAAVETAEDGAAGVAAAARGQVDLILMDVQMPGMDGLEATRRIRTLESPAAATPIIALTANVLAHQHAAYLQAGMDGVVGKPIAPAALIAEIARLSQVESDAA
ncbi:MAG: PAS domain S-box protein [Phenylobacterium sp.]|uniref:PAS domain-containing hybrid sensor histidine kinase/response regulator n=1 Tax=Phenylobacterium sp. TaxID=1871053 RepID=UPI003919BDED